MRRLHLERLEPRYALASGELDPAFGDRGIVEAEFDKTMFSAEDANLIVRQSDGKIILAGTSDIGHGKAFALSRLFSDGTVDRSFGDNGVVITPFAGDAAPTALAVQPDGKILLAEDSNKFVRYLPNGLVDTAFGVGGKSLDVDGTFAIRSLEVQADGEILAAVIGPSSYGVAVVRLEADGSLDESFGWRDVISPGGTHAHDAELELQSDGRFVVAAIFGTLDSPFQRVNYDLYLSRFLSTGEYDRSFAGDGNLTTRLSSNVGYYTGNLELEIQPDGKPLVATLLQVGTGVLPSLLRFNADGSSDIGFGIDGRVTLDSMQGTYQFVQGLAVQPDGRIVAHSYSVQNAQGQFDPHYYVARRMGDGSVDSSWDGDGTLVVPYDSDRHFGTLTSRPDGGILLAGMQRVGGGSRDFLVQACNSAGQLDAGFHEDGISVVDYQASSAKVHEAKTKAMPDGRLMLAGSVTRNASTGWILRRYVASGEVDASFGGDGEVGLDALDPLTESVVDWVAQPDGGLIVCFRSYAPDWTLQHRLARLLPNGELDTAFGQNGFATISDSRLDLVPLTTAVDASGRIYVAGYGENPTPGLSLDSRPSFAIRVTSGGRLDVTYGTQGITILPVDPQYQAVWTLPPTFSGNGTVEFYRSIDSPEGRRLLVQKLGSSGEVVAQISLSIAVAGSPHALLARDASILPDGAYQVAGFRYSVDGYGRALFQPVVRRFKQDGTPDIAYGTQGEAAIGAVVNSADDLEVATRRDGSVWVAAQGTDWDRHNIDIFVTQITPAGMIEESFGENGTVRLTFHEYDDLLRSAVLVPDGVIIAATTQTGHSRNLVLAKIGIDVPPSPWQNPGNPLDVDGDPTQTIVALDALIIINVLNRVGSYRLDEFADPQTVNAFYDVNGDYHVTALDALIIINWLNRNPVPPGLVAGEGLGEGEADSADFDVDVVSASSDELDPAAVAMLMSSLENDRRR